MPVVMIEGLRPGAHTIKLIKEIRAAGNLDLPGARRIVDAAEAGQRAEVPVVRGSPSEVIVRLVRCGAIVEYGGKRHALDEVELPDYHDSICGHFAVSGLERLDDAHLIIRGEVRDGELKPGCRLGVPLDCTLIVTARILAAEGGRLTVESGLAEHDLWAAMAGPGALLPVLRDAERFAQPGL